MTINSQLLLMLSALGALNGFLISAYFFFTKPVNLANRFLALMLLMFSVRILKSVLFYFNPEIDKVILQVGLTACFFIGPFLFLYCASKMQQLAKQPLPWQLHIALLASTSLLIGFIYPYQDNEALWGVFYRFINYIWLLYILLSARLLMPFFKGLTAKKARNKQDIWLLSVFIGNIIIWLAYFTASYTSYIVGALSFSFILYLTGLLTFTIKSKAVEQQTKKYANKEISANEAEQKLQQLDAMMQEQQLFKNANLTLPMLAKRLGVSVPYLSQLLNDNVKSSFADYINSFRIEEAKNLLISEHRLTMELIAERCGFNSQSTFYSTFKKFTEKTPAKYRKENQ
ncbi:helix-turn-helix domain-containing protein [Litorilituus sediminis]|uniref:Helix-turn-helix domain-containing protein n=1 Tax=Litorilituus sediminis TaxID=718192 RepID=A0A4P6PBH5_9GAMM|nr:helix-turn-helix domain-containing protein [Litorilituus sediminis]QBG36987.1 helix-turn-helix domain-containing protein [Litorilituus sediminis]